MTNGRKPAPDVKRGEQLTGAPEFCSGKVKALVSKVRNAVSGKEEKQVFIKA